jgi:signal peptidase
VMAFAILSKVFFDRNDRNLFGFRFYIVLSDSMSPSENNKDDKIKFSAGDLIFTKKVKNPEKLKEGDVISFISQNSVSFGETVTHKIKEVVKNEDGKVVGYRTYGTNTGATDEAMVIPDYVLGKYAGKIPGAGNFLDFMKTKRGYIVCILIPFLLLILSQGVSTVKLYRQYRKEQMADFEAEREAEREKISREREELSREREESRAMMEELRALREQLAKQNNEQPPKPEKESDDSSDEKKNDDYDSFFDGFK